MKYFLIINPRSGSGRSRKKSARMLDGFRQTGLNFDHVFASSYQSVRAQSEYANRKGYDAVIAVGGDGTVNAAINGFYDAGGKRISTACFGVLYTGTSPDFCKSYGIPLDEKDAVQTLVHRNTRRIRLGRIAFRNATGMEIDETRVFACCANIGLGAGVASMSNRIRKYTGDFAGTLIAILGNLVSHGSFKMTATIDGITSEITRIVNISAGRTKYIASGIRVSDGMQDVDGRLYLLTAKNVSVRVLPKLLYQVYTGKFTSPEILEFRFMNIATFQSTGGSVGVEFDGDAAGCLPCSIDMAPDPLDLIVLP
jgi:diacylglycerol kinase family enzyme